MTSLAALWLPIIVAAVFMFVASSIVHMVLPWHKGDYPKLAREQEFLDAIRPLDIPPGDYMAPRAQSMEEMKSPDFLARYERGPRVIMTVLRPGPMSMSRELTLWFVYLLVIAIFAAYVASRAVPPGGDYLQVFRFAGVSAFLGLAGGLWQMAIWYHRSMRVTVLSTIDALLYALIAAGAFGWLWPK